MLPVNPVYDICVNSQVCVSYLPPPRVCGNVSGSVSEQSCTGLRITFSSVNLIQAIYSELKKKPRSQSVQLLKGIFSIVWLLNFPISEFQHNDGFTENAMTLRTAAFFSSCKHAFRHVVSEIRIFSNVSFLYHHGDLCWHVDSIAAMYIISNYPRWGKNTSPKYNVFWISLSSTLKDIQHQKRFILVEFLYHRFWQRFHHRWKISNGWCHTAIP